jgi:hypothetical protein
VVFEDVLRDDFLDYYGVGWHFLLDYTGDLDDLLNDAVDVLDLSYHFLYDYEYLGRFGLLLGL